MSAPKAYDRYRRWKAGEAREHPLYKEAIDASGGRSLVLSNKLENLFFLITEEMAPLASRDIVEFGAFRGGSALFMAYLLRALYPEARFFALDTFTGMPATDPNRDLPHRGFQEADLEGFRARKNELGLDNLLIVPGLIQDTFRTLPVERIGLAHIDVDIYSAVLFAQEASWPKVVSGGFLVYDDAEYPTCLGATHAAEEFKMEHRLLSEQVWPHWVMRKP